MKDDSGTAISTSGGGPYRLHGVEVYIYPFGDHQRGYDFTVMRDWGLDSTPDIPACPCGQAHSTAAIAAQHFLDYCQAVLVVREVRHLETVREITLKQDTTANA